MEVVEQQYKDTKIGKIPVDWEVVKLEEVCDSVRDGTHDSPKPKEKGYKLLTSKNLKSGSINYTNCYYISEEDYIKINKRSKVDQFDLLYGMIGTIGNPVIIMKEEIDFAVKNVAIFKTGGNKDLAEYLVQYFNSNIVDNYIERNKDGGVQSFVSLGFLRKFPVILPPLTEQKKIATILSTVDEQIATTTAIIQQTQQLKKGLMQQLFSKGIGHTTFKKTKIGEIPESWEVVKLEEISGFITKGSTPTTYGFEWVDKGIPFLRSECVSKYGFIESGMKYISDEAHKALKRSQILEGDILMTITGNVGRVVEYPFKEGNINQHIAIIRITNTSVISVFVLHQLLQEKYIQNYSRIVTGAAYPQLSLKQVRETLISLPPLIEQKKIATILTEVDDKIQAEQQQKARLEELKKGLMQVLLTGQVRVNI